jgi:hypothetical protein
MARNRIIYQSEALYIGQPDGTGYHAAATCANIDSGKSVGLVAQPSTIDSLVVPNSTNWTLVTTPASQANKDLHGAWVQGDTYAAGAKVSLTEATVKRYYVAKVGSQGESPLKALTSKSSGSDGHGLNPDGGTDADKWTIHAGARQLSRVQSANYSFTINRQDVNQFGQLARIDSVAIDPPTVSLDFSYYLTNGENEANMGFKVGTALELAATTTNFVQTDELEKQVAGRNFFILTTPEGTDAVGSSKFDDTATPPTQLTGTIEVAGGDLGAVVGTGAAFDTELSPGDEIKIGTEIRTVDAIADADNLTVTADFSALVGAGADIYKIIDSHGPDSTADTTTIALGNGFISNYSMEAAVGGMPTASVTVEGLNLQSNTGFHNIDIPAVNPDDGKPVDGISFSLPEAISAIDDPQGGASTKGFSCLRPGDIEMTLGTAGAAGLMTNLPGSANTVHVQNFSIDVPMSRTPLQRLGNPYSYTKPLDYPLTITCSISAIASDLKDGNVTSQLFEFTKHNLTFTLKDPSADGSGDNALTFELRGAQVDSESFSSTIGDNKSVDISFSVQVGGPEDKAAGLFVAGSRAGDDGATGLVNFDPFVTAT